MICRIFCFALLYFATLHFLFHHIMVHGTCATAASFTGSHSPPLVRRFHKLGKRQLTHPRPSRVFGNCYGPRRMAFPGDGSESAVGWVDLGRCLLGLGFRLLIIALLWLTLLKYDIGNYFS